MHTYHYYIPIILTLLLSLLLIRGRIRRSFPYVSYEATKRVSRWQRVYSMGLGRPPIFYQDIGSNAANILKISIAQSILNLFYSWCMLLTRLHPKKKSIKIATDCIIGTICNMVLILYRSLQWTFYLHQIYVLTLP